MTHVPILGLKQIPKPCSDDEKKSTFQYNMAKQTVKCRKKKHYMKTIAVTYSRRNEFSDIESILKKLPMQKHHGKNSRLNVSPIIFHFQTVDLMRHRI